MKNWQKQFKVDPLPFLLSSASEPLRYFARRDLVDEEVCPIHCLWELPQA